MPQATALEDTGSPRPSRSVQGYEIYLTDNVTSLLKVLMRHGKGVQERFRG
ncbi:MAG: hypothetical protein ACLU2K_05945 [Clostridia bacterium]